MIAACAWIAGIGVGWLTLGGLVAIVLGRAIRAGDCCPHAVDAPDGTAGDLLAGIPVECLSEAQLQAMFVRLVAPLDAERDRPGRVIRP